MDGETAFYFRFVLAVLNHPLVTLIARAEIEELKYFIRQHSTFSSKPRNWLCTLS